MVFDLSRLSVMPLPIWGGTGLFGPPSTGARIPWHTNLSDIANVSDSALLNDASWGGFIATAGLGLPFGVPAWSAWSALRAASALASGPSFGFNPFQSPGYFRPGAPSEQRTPGHSSDRPRWNYQPRSIPQAETGGEEPADAAESAAADGKKAAGGGKDGPKKTQKPVKITGTPESSLGTVTGTAAWVPGKKSVMITLTATGLNQAKVNNAAVTYAKNLSKAGHKGITVTVTVKSGIISATRTS